MTRLQLTGLSKRFGAHAQPAVDDIDLEIDSGEIVALLGPSGCGKTTTLKMIAGLLQPDAGDVLLDGKSVLSLPPERRSAVMVFQEHALFPFMSVGSNVGFGLRVRGVGRTEIQRRVDQMLQLVQLPGVASRSPRELSGGQQQRVALARALITEPKLLLLDEPLANLDAWLRDEMRSLILSVQRQTGVTTLVVTHDQEEAVMLAHRIALMFDGRIAHYGPPMELFQQPRSRRAAAFFGGKNFIPAIREGELAHTALGDFLLDPASLAGMPEGPAILTIRPEHIAVNGSSPDSPSGSSISSLAGGSTATGPAHPSGGLACNTISGQLDSCIFLGTHTRCIVSAGGFRLEALKSVDSTMLQEGGGLSLRFPPEHIWLFQGDGMAGGRN
jgi:ABC-type Fe3+/spermidine/putrescine transport system ATPase subunit